MPKGKGGNLLLLRKSESLARQADAYRESAVRASIAGRERDSEKLMRKANSLRERSDKAYARAQDSGAKKNPPPNSVRLTNFTGKVGQTPSGQITVQGVQMKRPK